jgi:hypothetical protein
VEGTKLAEKEWGLLNNTDVKRLERHSGLPFLEKPLNRVVFSLKAIYI